MGVELPEGISETVDRIRREAVTSFEDTRAVDRLLEDARRQISGALPTGNATVDPFVARSIELRVRSILRDFRDRWMAEARSAATRAVDLAVAHHRILGGTGSVDRDVLVKAAEDRIRVHSGQYVVRTLRGVEQRVALSMSSGEGVNALVRDLTSGRAGVLADRWRVDRIERTERSRAYNSTAAKAAGAGKVRWTELVDDVTFRPLDKRVGVDSIWLHGQVRTFGEPFDDKVIGGAPLMPPNRPHDRGVLVPVKDEWVDRKSA